MSVPTIEAPAAPVVPAATATPDAPVVPEPNEPKPTETVEFWKAQSRTQEARAKANADAATELAALKDAAKSEEQKTLDRTLAAERERDQANAEKLQYKAAAENGIGADYMDLLMTPAGEEAILARAVKVGTLVRENAEMKAELEALRAGRPAPTSGRPTEALKPGATPVNNKTEADVVYDSLFGVKP